MPSQIKPRIFYFAPVLTEELKEKFGTSDFIGAACHKTFAVCDALRSAGAFPIVVSGLISARPGEPAWCEKHMRLSKTVYSRIYTAGRGLSKRLTASVSFLVYAIRHIRRNDIVMLYNGFPDYVLAALYLKLAGHPAVIDIEDAPREDEKSLFALSTRLSFRILRILSAGKYVTVGQSVAHTLGLKRFLAINGVADYYNDSDQAPEKFAGEYISVLFGGSLFHDTGLDLFQASVRLLAAREPELPLRFIITGIFAEDAFSVFKTEIEAKSRFKVDIAREISAAHYKRLAQGADIGLSLRLSSSSISQTTFPSKVLEFGAMGMLICSTKTGDIPYLFDDNSAALLTDDSPEELARLLAMTVKDRPGAVARARLGQAIVLRKFSRESVGAQLLSFLTTD